MNLRIRRMETEWQLLESLADTNKTALALITRLQDEFRVAMCESPAWVRQGSEQRIETRHELRYIYPRYYPSLPLEGYFARPISHINVDPATGFVCLWKNYRPSQTIVDAVLITRAIMAGNAANWDLAHRMQHEVITEPLPMPSLTIPVNCRALLPQRSYRQRLSSEIPNDTLQVSRLAISDIE